MRLLAELGDESRLYQVRQALGALALVRVLRALLHLRIVIAAELCFASAALLGLVAKASLQLAEPFVLLLGGAIIY